MKKKKYYRFDANMWIMNILCIVLFVVPFYLLVLCGYSFNIDFSSLYFFPVVLLYFGIHELCHGFGYSLFAKDKKNIKYGIALEKGVFYAMCQEKLSKKAIFISILMPLFVLTVLVLPFSLIFHLDFLTMLALMNFGGAIGDILMAILIIKCPSDIEYIDYDDGIGMCLISSHDLRKIKSLGLHVTEYGNEEDKKVNESIKKITCTKFSIIFLLVILLIIFLPEILSWIF